MPLILVVHPVIGRRVEIALARILMSGGSRSVNEFRHVILRNLVTQNSSTCTQDFRGATNLGLVFRQKVGDDI